MIADLAVGISRPGVQMTPQTLMLWYSAGKPVTAVAVAQLWERGRLDLDSPIAQYIPEFGQRGKEILTARHLLTHTGGFRGIINNTMPQSIDDLLRQVYNLRIETGWTPGRTAGYHAASSWFVLGELVERLSGKPLWRYVRDEIFLPLGMNDSWIGMPREQYRAYGERIGLMHELSGEQPEFNLFLDREENADQARPGANARGPTRELGRFYEMTLAKGSLDGVRVLREETIAEMTRRQREGLADKTFGQILDWGLGFAINSKKYGAEIVPYGFGQHASDQAFGHGGQRSSMGLADPAHGLVIALLFNGMPPEAQHQKRADEVLSTIYEELGISGRG